jgi:hypothetical protein
MLSSIPVTQSPMKTAHTASSGITRIEIAVAKLS